MPARIFESAQPPIPLLKVLFRLTFSQPPAVRLTGMLVCGFRVLQLIGFDHTFFLRPTLVNALETPFRAAPGGTDRLTVDHHENRIRMRGGQNAQRDPAAALDG